MVKRTHAFIPRADMKLRVRKPPRMRVVDPGCVKTTSRIRFSLRIAAGDDDERFVEGADRGQLTLLPECLDDWIDESNPVRVIDAFVEALDLGELGFNGVEPAATGRPSYHPSVLLKLYIYGYLNRVQSSRRLEREAGRNLEVIWLLGRLVPDDKVIADFRKDNGSAIRKVCARFVELCRKMGLLTKASAAIDGSKFKAVNNRDKNFTRNKVERRRAQLEESVARYLSQLDTADLQEPSEALATRTAHLKEKLAKLASELQRLKTIEKEIQTGGEYCPVGSLIGRSCLSVRIKKSFRWSARPHGIGIQVDIKRKQSEREHPRSLDCPPRW